MIDNTRTRTEPKAPHAQRQNAKYEKGRRLYGPDRIGRKRSFRSKKAQGMGRPIRPRPSRMIKYREAVA
jgi:hypothetical protein